MAAELRVRVTWLVLWNDRRQCRPGPSVSALFVRLRAKDAEPPHFVEQSCALDPQARRSPVVPSDHPIGSTQSFLDKVAFGFRKRTNLCGGIFDRAPQLLHRRSQHGVERQDNRALYEVLQFANI